ncbi:MAG: class I SAM-dependent methyltransferase [Terracidiphilus sp.]
MSIKEKVARNLSMLYSVFKTEGLMPGAECWVRQVGAKLLGMSDAGHPRTNVFLFHLTDCLYDSIHGTNTGGVIDLPEMEGNGRNYVGTPPRAWKLLLRHLPIDSSRFTYFDLGCGKGRTLLLASAVGFKRVIGVDISSQLLSIARSNLKRKGMDGELICADVRTVEFPCDPLVVFMYNPFYEDVMRQVAENLGESLRRHPREAYVLYYSAAFADAWKVPGFEILQSSNAHYPNYVIYQYRVAGEEDASIHRGEANLAGVCIAASGECKKLAKENQLQ